MNKSFRHVEDVALKHVRRDQLASANWPAYQRWTNLVKEKIIEEIRLGNQRIEWYNKLDQIKK